MTQTSKKNFEKNKLGIHSGYELDMKTIFIKKKPTTTNIHDETWQADVSPATECIILNIKSIIASVLFSSKMSIHVHKKKYSVQPNEAVSLVGNANKN